MDPFLGEIRLFAGNFAPRGWAFCNGQLLQISQSTALFSLLGTTYGGDGRATFGLPNLQSRFPMHFGQGPGLTLRTQGEVGGEATVTLDGSTIPPHNHALMATATAGSTGTPAGGVALAATGDNSIIYRAGGARTPMGSTTVGPAGSNGAHNNVQPYLALNFIIALEGVYPSRG